MTEPVKSSKAQFRRKDLSLGNRVARGAWGIVWLFLYRPSPRLLHGWRRMLLRLFGARVGKGAHPYPTCRIWAPWNLIMEAGSCLSDHVDCYCVDRITLGENCVVSQYAFLCSASHDADDPEFPLITAPIDIGQRAWVAADAFIGPGVTIGAGAVVGARSSVFRDVAGWTVVGGNPARFIRNRKRPD